MSVYLHSGLTGLWAKGSKPEKRGFLIPIFFNVYFQSPQCESPVGLKGELCLDGVTTDPESDPNQFYTASRKMSGENKDSSI